MEEEIVDIQERLSGIRNDLDDILYDLDNLEIPEINKENAILDVKDFIEKLDDNKLLTEELKNYIEYYMKFFNK